MSDYSALVLSHGSLIGYWRLGDSIGNPLDDAGPNGLDGNYAASGLTYGVTGAIANDADTAVTGDGSTDIASVPGNALLDLVDGPFTYELWLKRSATQGAVQTLLAKGSGAASFRFAANNKIEVIKQGTAGAIATSASALTDTTAWHHVVLTKNGAATKIYVDGADVTVAGTNQTLVNNSPTALRIGAFSASTQFFPGSLDEVAVYGAVLTPAEVLDHYEVGSGLIKLNGASAGTGTAAGDLTVARPLVGTSAGQGTATADLTVAHPLEGSAAGVGTASGDVTVSWTLEGTSAGAGTASGVLDTTLALAGSSSGAASATGDLTVAVDLQGAAAATSTASGELGLDIPLAGDSAGAGTATASLLVVKPLEGSAAGTSMASGGLSMAVALAGSSTGAGTASASLTGDWALAGSSAGTSTATGTLRAVAPGGELPFSSRFIEREPGFGRASLGPASLGRAAIKR